MFISSDKNIMISLGIWTAAFKLIGILTMMTFNGRFYRISKKDEKQSVDSIQSCIPVYCQPILNECNLTVFTHYEGSMPWPLSYGIDLV